LLTLLPADLATESEWVYRLIMFTHHFTHHSGAALVACLLVAGAERATAQTANVKGTTWVLSSLPGRALIVGASPTLQFDADRVGGTDGCNSFTTPYTSAGTSLHIGRPGEGPVTVSQVGASTSSACPELVSRQATAFMTALTLARSYRLDRGQLQLIADNGGVLATLGHYRATLAGTSWAVNSYENGKQEVVGVLQETPLTMTFGADGRVSGWAGCNTFNGAYTSHGDGLKFGTPAATRKACARPSRVMEQEQQFLRALAMVATSRFEADRVDLLTADGDVAVSLKRTGGTQGSARSASGGANQTR